MNVIDAIKERRSIRSFDGEALSVERKALLKEAIDNSSSPFGGRVTIRLKEFDLRDGYTPSTYGVIRGASSFFLLGIGDDEESAFTAGFRFEQVVLKAWELGLGTCWIAATFKGSEFDCGEAWYSGEALKIVCPVGVPAKPRFIEKMARLAFGSKKRKDFSELFYNRDFRHSLSPNNRFGQSLAMLRLAPSSTNSQPWRALVDGDTVHFYCRLKGDLSVLDCGIGICHFYEAEKYQGYDGEFCKVADAPAPMEGWRYLYSYKWKL